MTTNNKTYSIYLISIDGQPRYIGETGQRLQTRFRSHFWKASNAPTSNWDHVLRNAVSRSAIVEINVIDTATGKSNAKAKEEYYTRMYRSIGHQIENRSIGGKYDPASRALIAAATKRQERTLGPGKGVLQAVPVIDLETGKTFGSVSEAARSIGALQSSLTLAIKRGYRCHGHRFARLTDVSHPANDNAQRVAA